MPTCTDCNVYFGSIAEADNHDCSATRIELKLGVPYRMKNGNVTTMRRKITADDGLTFEAGYAFEDIRGRHYTDSGDHNNPDFVIVGNANDKPDQVSGSRKLMIKKLEKFLRDGGYHLVAYRAEAIIDYITSK